MYKENFENLLEELREKECLGMVKYLGHKEKLYIFTKTSKVNLSCPLLQVIQGETDRKRNSNTHTEEREGGREKD